MKKIRFNQFLKAAKLTDMMAAGFFYADFKSRNISLEEFLKGTKLVKQTVHP